MGLTGRLRAFALARPHVLVIEGAGGTAVRLEVERLCRLWGWPAASDPRDADVVAVCGEVPPGMRRPLERVRRAVPPPREAVVVGPADDPADSLRAAARRLQDWDRQRAEATRALGEEAVPFRHGDVGGLFSSNVGEGPPAGRTMPYRAADRDDETLDVLHVPLGPIMAAWPHGLRLRTRLQGDVVQAADFDTEALAGSTTRPSYWDGPWIAALEGQPVTVEEAERRRALSHLDSVTRLLLVAGDPRLATTAARLRDALADGADAPPMVDGVVALRRSLDRSRLLDGLTDGLGILTAEEAQRRSLSGPVLRAAGVPADLRASSPEYGRFDPVVAVGQGDARSRWRQWLAEAEQSLRLAADGGGGRRRMVMPADGAVEGPRGRLGAVATAATAPALSVLHDLLLGRAWSDVRYLVASFDPDPQQLAWGAAVATTGEAAGA